MKSFSIIPVALIMVSGAANAAEQHAAASAGNLLQVLFGLAVVLALMAAAAWTLKRFGTAKNNTGTTVRIVGGISVGSRERILVVEVADQWIVVGVAPGRISTLSSMPRQQQTGAPEAALESIPGSATGAMTGAAPAAKNFSAWLKQTIERRNGKQA